MIWVNGRPAEYLRSPKDLQMFSEYAFGSRQAGCVSSQSPPLPIWDRHSGGSPNTIRLGEVSDLGFGAFPRNQSADMTMDEFYMYRINEPFSLVVNGVDIGQANVIQDEVILLRDEAVKQWSAGRYYRPQSDSVFTSAPIQLKMRDRKFAAPMNGGPKGTNDVITGVPSAPSAPKSSAGTVAESGVGIRTGAPARRTRLLGFSWTWYPEEISRRSGKGISLDYRPKIRGQVGAAKEYVKSDDDEIEPGDDSGSDAGYRGAGALDLAPSKSNFKWNNDLDKLTPFSLLHDEPQCSVSLRIVTQNGEVRREFNGDGKWGYKDDGMSKPFDTHTGKYLELNDDDYIQYVVKFHVDGLQDDSILLGTPVFDDITFYFAADEIEFLSWSHGEARK